MVGSVETKQSAFAMTEEQKFFYDLRGWILIPNVLLSSEIDEMKAEAYACDGSRSLRNSRGYVDSLQKLLDHPAIVGILTEILSEPPYLSDDYYSFRCENSFISIRHRVGAISNEQDSENHIPSNNLPHVVRPPQQANAMRYQVKGNKIYSGLTRVVWELEEVKAGQGGTSFLSGSHKANFNYGGPDPYRANISESPWEESMRETMKGYSCPAGSVVIFTESLIHAANEWTNPNNPRCAVFNCYNSLWAQWYLLNLDHEIIKKMAVKRRSLFRGTWKLGELNGSGNFHYSADNRSL